MAKGYGDRLARGTAKAVFPASEAGLSQEKFDQALNDFDPQAYIKNAEAAEEQARVDRAARLAREATEREQYEREREERRSNSNAETTGVSSPNS